MLDKQKGNPRQRVSTDGFFYKRAAPRHDVQRKITRDFIAHHRANVATEVQAPPPIARPRPVPPPIQPPKPPVEDPQQPAQPSLLGITLTKDFGQLGPSSAAKHKPKKGHRVNWRKVAKRSALVLVFLLIVSGGWVGWKVVHNINKVFGGNIITDAQAVLSTNQLKGESTGRVNILLAGDSADDPGHQGADLTDSIMVVSLDTKNDTGFMLSIPRDLWVNIPGMGHEKINAANTATSFSTAGYPAGGMGQLEQIVSQDLGIPIDYYALIDYSAFRDAVNAVGGITINVQSPDPRGLYDPNTNLKLPNGEVTLTGQEALNLARARGDGYGAYGFPQADFDRTEHQRQMLVAVEQKALSAGVLSNPLKVGQLFDALGNNVKTDLTVNDAVRLVQLSKVINISSLQSLTYNYGGTNSLLKNYSAPDGEDALIPEAGLDNFSQLQNYYQQLTSSNPLVTENASVVVLNGSNVVGLAHQEETVLEGKGFNVASIADASAEYPASMIVDLSKGQDPNTKQALEKTFSTNTTTVTSTTGSAEAGEATNYSADFVVILGGNWNNTTVTGPVGTQ